MFFKTLSRAMKGERPTQNHSPKNMMSRLCYEVELNETRALLLKPKIEFLLNSMNVSFDLQFHLQMADQKNSRVSFIVERVQAALNKPNYTKEKYEEVEALGAIAVPLKQHIAKKGEFMRLKNSLIRSQDDELRYWELMEYFLVTFLIRAAVPTETGNILEKFKSKKLLKDQHLR